MCRRTGLLMRPKLGSNCSLVTRARRIPWLVAENRLLHARDPLLDVAVLAGYIQVLIDWALGVRRVVIEGR